MRSIIVLEKNDEQLRWDFVKEEYITCRVRAAMVHKEIDFEVDEWVKHVKYCEGDYMVPVDRDHMIILTEDEMQELIMEHREHQADVDGVVDDCETLGKDIGEALGYVLQGMIEDPDKYPIDIMTDAKDTIIRRLQGILSDIEDGVW